VNIKNFDKYLIILWILCGTALLLYAGHYTEVLIDYGREVYYPQRVLEGGVLYKDLLNIYGPFSYQFNAVLYKVFGINLKSLYISGGICSMLLISGIYLTAKHFLSDFLSFSLAFFAIIAGVMSPNIMNFTFPYSWAMLYGTTFFTFSFLFLLKYPDKCDVKYLYISSLLAGGSIASKYEFLAYSFVILFFIVKAGRKHGFAATGFFSVIPLVSFGILFLQGLRISDLVSACLILKAMAGSHTLKYFYTRTGAYFSQESIPFLISNFIQTAAAFGGLMLAAFLSGKNKIAAWLLAVCSLIYIFFKTSSFMLTFLPALLVVFSVMSFRKLAENKKILLLVVTALSVSLKSIFGLIFSGYGLYFVTFLLTAFFALLFLYLPKKYQKTAGFYILFVSCIVMSLYMVDRYHSNYEIKTSKGIIYTNPGDAKSINELTGYLQTRTKPEDTVVIFPEGMMINFLAGRKGDDFYNSLLPLYVEVFKEDKITEHFERTKPEYFVLSNQSMKNYYFEYMCQDYAFFFCEYIQQNYTREATIDNSVKYPGTLRFLVYRRNK
jgi:hypothetical protein